MAYCDGYDELLRGNGHAEESLNSIEYRLQQMVDKVSQITEDTVKKCLDIFSGIGANGDWRYLL